MKWTNSCRSVLAKALPCQHLRPGTYLATSCGGDGMPVFPKAAVVTEYCCHIANWLALWTRT